MARRRRCAVCKKLKSLQSFHKNKTKKGGYHNRCKLCEKRRGVKRNLEDNYGITKAEKLFLYELQGHSCAICKRFHSIRFLHVDHDHAKYLRKRDGNGTKSQRRNSVRGLLCSPCNKSLGWYEIVNPMIRSKWEVVEDYTKNPPAKILWEQDSVII